MSEAFEFRDPGKLMDDELELVLVEKYPGDPAINHVPAYKFKMTRMGQDQEIGRIQLRIGNPDNIASRRTCELAGAQFVETVDLPEDTDMYKRGERQSCRYRLDL